MVHDTVVRNAVPRRPARTHQPWCDAEQHALALVDSRGDSGCVGRYIRRGAVGGWVVDDGAGPRIVLDWQPSEDSLSAREAADLGALMASLVAESQRPARTGWFSAWRR